MLGPLLSTVALVQIKNRAQQAMHNAVLGVIAGALGLVAVAFLIAAGYAALLPVLGAIWTSVIAAVLFAVAAAVAYGLRRTAPPATRGPLGGAAMLGALGAAAGNADDDDRPRRPRRAGPGVLGGSNKLLVILPAIAFAAAVVAGRRGRAKRWEDDRWS